LGTLAGTAATIQSATLADTPGCGGLCGGDPNDAANYKSIASPVTAHALLDNEALKLSGPDNQKNYAVNAGKLVIVGGP
jgi:hypothetical protein